jgi:hypothetical protein
LEVPLAVARAFVKDMLAFHSEPNAIKRDEIAARRLHDEQTATYEGRAANDQRQTYGIGVHFSDPSRV